jgi:hypothetical protein
MDDANETTGEEGMVSMDPPQEEDMHDLGDDKVESDRASQYAPLDFFLFPKTPLTDKESPSNAPAPCCM